MERDPTTSAGPWRRLPNRFRSLAAQISGALLLETAKQDTANDRSFLFLDPVDELIARTAEDLDAMLHAIDEHTAAGRFVAGYVSYECGEHLMGLRAKQAACNTAGLPLAWFGVYGAPIAFHHRTGSIEGDLPGIAAIAAPQHPAGELLTIHGLDIAKDDYAAKIARIHAWLAAGDTYQVNFTGRISGTLHADPLTLYSTLLEQQPVSFAAYVNHPEGPILSFSPELFYRTSHGSITVRPMKGTWPRGVNCAADDEAEQTLRADEKNRSEHIMIVDLLRNDIGRVCELGSVRVESLFDVERYATLLQMTSTVSGTLRPSVTPSEIFRNLFPSGSITGAPKRRTMEIIRELEAHPRGVYTGAIGYFAPGGEACFSVAIRTMSLHGNSFTLGVGGGITADSRAEDEYRECELKAAFLTKRDRPFQLIETIRCEKGIALLAKHLHRLAASAHYFDIAYDQPALRHDLEAAIRAAGSRETRIRLLLDLTGTWTIESTPLDTPHWTGRILLASQTTRSTDPFLHHKTTNRAFYNEQFAHATNSGFNEVLFLNEHNQLTEGAISNIFLEVNGEWITPALSCGVLPGVQRAALLEQRRIREASITLEDLARASAIRMANALRGLRPISIIEREDGTIVWRSPQ